ncbi:MULTISPECIES: poly-gamma-glutamate hydrolase family protein [Peribacillus]|uniref:poly-gamma-glutamate hydrolase family protein n=1 Tax=Peribacillus TaxID=2675229 RepID=UPI001F4E8B69|nr:MULTISPECIES: poly-gamma-glutamate hydrolase family protein [unclassified Peribacillus]MCK1981584.1 poly-gamma-glutamate hydrolase family protein [Peribacillus sp. Aquil_B1]MCK2006669.1 poly-gamma-glutamate hydrolase family protein [Peribacillus sp. Aquil_B8]
MKENNYTDFIELKQNEQEDLDYRIIVHHRNPNIAVLAIHGGNIEPGTSEIAAALGERLYASTYLFEGLKPRGNQVLHITSRLFNEPVGVSMASNAQTTLSIHGHYDVHHALVYIGGRNEPFKNLIQQCLTKAGFQTEHAPQHLSGMKGNNITNISQTGAGVQLELSTMLRKSFFKGDDFTSKNRSNHCDLFKRFVTAIEKATLEYKQIE